MWWQLKGRALEVKFRRQVVILGYIVDFACLSHKLIVELDGSQHSDSLEDDLRDRNLTAAGWTVLRFWSWEVFDENEMVIDTISKQLDEIIPFPFIPSPKRGRVVKGWPFIPSPKTESHGEGGHSG